MGKRDEKRKLGLRRERLRQLTELTTDEAGEVFGGDGGRFGFSRDGRVITKTCR